ncbi:hypothetical protein MBLNU459_g3728t1 [Dothideomycetes sp. NU459]
MAEPSCCICSSILDTFDAKTEKPIVAARTLSCCLRTICQLCIAKNPRYNTYCPYCQITTGPSSLPQGLRDPPSYDSLDAKSSRPPSEYPDKHGGDDETDPPAYSAQAVVQPIAEKASAQAAPDVLHFLTPDDSLRSLSLAYRVPIDALRKTNNVFADHLVAGRRTILIPGEYYKGGVSLSPRPVEGEEEEAKKSKLRRWMVACKVADLSARLRYDVALLYLDQTEYNLEAAIEAYKEDERWEKEHPLDTSSKSKRTARSAGMRRFVGSSNASASR